MSSDLPSDLVASIPANLGNTFQIDLYTKDTKKARSYAGHVDIDGATKVLPTAQNHLFYWFFESQTCDPHVAVDDQQELISSTPLIIWLNGGPGASSLLGLFLENGPFTIGGDAAGTISVTPDSWNQEAHVVYWDQPIGTGYSYADSGTYVPDEAALSQMFWEGLQEFFTRHSEYAKCPLYLCGESYAGKYVPAIALKIDEKNQDPKNQKINLQGISVGNGWIKPELAVEIIIDYAYTTGFIGSDQKNDLYKSYTDFQKALHAGKMEEAADRGNALVATTLAYGGNFDMYDVRRWQDLPMGALGSYLNSADVKIALHVPEKVSWECADNDGPVAVALKKDNMADCSELFKTLLGEDYRLLFYTGNFDTACGYRSTEEILSGLEKWGDPEEDQRWLTAPRLIWTQAQGNPKGFVRQYRNLTQVSVPDSGHQVPAFQPQICREMIYNWIFQRPFSGHVPGAAHQGRGFNRWNHSPRRAR